MDTSTSIFQFLRGALRGAYGQEDLRHKRILIVGQEDTGRYLLKYLCLDDTYVYIAKAGLKAYANAFGVCQGVEPYNGQELDVTIDTINGFVSIKGKAFPIKDITTNAYNQGFSEYYLV